MAVAGLGLLTIQQMVAPSALDSLLPSGPAHSGWVLRFSGLASSLGSAPVRAAVLAVALAWLAATRRWRDLSYVVAVVATVHLADRVGKSLVRRARPIDVQRGYALAPSLRLVVIAAILGVGLLVLARQWRSAALWMAPAYLGVLGLAHLTSAVPVGVGADSFPSGHASNTMAVLAGLAFIRPARHRWEGPVLIGGALVAAVGVSRVTLGFHHVPDVLAGWCLALVLAYVLRLLVLAATLWGAARREPQLGAAGVPR